MKKLVVLVAVLTALFSVAKNQVMAQSYHTDGGVLVVDESLLSPTHKTIVFVVAKDIPQSVEIKMQTYMLMEGITHQFKPLQFADGVKRGQVIPLWNGNFNQFHNTAWWYFQVIMSTKTDIYYNTTMFPIGSRESYKEPMITSITETGGYNMPYQILVRGIFDTTVPSQILINTNVFIPPKTVTQNPPGRIEFTLPIGNFDQFPPGKYLLTICQEGRCDTLQGRHR